MLGNDKNNNNNSFEYVSLQEATRLCNYSQEYLSLRARQGKLKSMKLGRNWVTTKEWLVEYAGRVEEYNNSINNNSHKKEKAEKIVKEQIIHFPPENLPIIQYPKLRLNFGTLRPGFAVALVLVLMIASGVFGKENLFKTYHNVAKYTEKVGQNIAVASQNILLASVHYKNGLVSVSDVISEYGGWLKENYFAADKLVSQQVVRGVENLSKSYVAANKLVKHKINSFITLLNAPQDVDIVGGYSIINKWVKQQVVKAAGRYSSADNFVEQKIAQGVQGMVDGYTAADNFISQQVVRGAEGVIDGYSVGDNWIEQQIVKGIERIYRTYYAVSKFVKTALVENKEQFSAADKLVEKKISDLISFRITLPKIAMPKITLPKIAMPEINIGGKISNGLQVISTSYFAASNFIEQRISTLALRISDGYFAADKFIEEKLVQFFAQKEGVDKNSAIVKEQFKESTDQLEADIIQDVQQRFGEFRQKLQIVQKEKEGVIVLPLEKGDEEATEERIQKLKESFSDEVKIEPKDEVSGIIKPIFRDPTEQEYLYMIIPVKN